MTDLPVLEIARIRIVSGGSEGFEAALREAAPLLLASPGCLGAEIYRVAEEPGGFRLVVRWRTVDDHRTGFQASPAFRRWREILGPWFEGLPQVEHLTDGQVLAG
jgi:quinol monooxygenase YgiN